MQDRPSSEHHFKGGSYIYSCKYSTCTYIHVHVLVPSFHLQLFRFIEVAPLLCVLDDFLDPLDSFCQAMEAQNTKTDDEPKETDAAGTANKPEIVEEEYLQGLELYCLLKCRLLDVQYRWKLVGNQSLPHEWKGMGRD